MSTLQISFKNTFLSFESPRPVFRKAHTTAFGERESDTTSVGSDLSSLGSFEMSTPSSPVAGQRNRVLDSYVASVGDCARTTVMVRGIPKNYDQDMLLAEVQAEGFPVNFLYLPPGKTKGNRSYGFVNFETEEAAALFLQVFVGRQWCQTTIAKQANVGYATLQGYSQNVEFFSKQEVAAGVSKRSPWVRSI